MLNFIYKQHYYCDITVNIIYNACLWVIPVKVVFFELVDYIFGGIFIVNVNVPLNLRFIEKKITKIAIFFFFLTASLS